MSIGRARPELAISLRLDPYAPRAARYHVAQVDRPSPDLRDAVVLLTSELVTRAVQRTEQASDAEVQLRVWMPADIVRVELQALEPAVARRPSQMRSTTGCCCSIRSPIAGRSTAPVISPACGLRSTATPSWHQISSVPTSAHTPAPARGNGRPGLRSAISWAIGVDFLRYDPDFRRSEARDRRSLAW